MIQILQNENFQIFHTFRQFFVPFLINVPAQNGFKNSAIINPGIQLAIWKIELHVFAGIDHNPKIHETTKSTFFDKNKSIFGSNQESF